MCQFLDFFVLLSKELTLVSTIRVSYGEAGNSMHMQKHFSVDLVGYTWWILSNLLCKSDDFIYVKSFATWKWSPVAIGIVSFQQILPLSQLSFLFFPLLFAYFDP